jgi:predicted nucleotidyltransferase
MQTIPHPHQQAFIDRFVAACQAAEGVRAALLIGSYAKGKADRFSDLDLYLAATDAAHPGFVAGREAFLKQLGDLVFLESFDRPDTAFYIFADGVEGELYLGRASQIRQTINEPYQVLLDKDGLLTEALPLAGPALPTDQTETLRRQIFGFWHEVSHFVTALGRGQLWWAFGQLEALRGICVNLARLQYSFADAEVGDEPYFKVETVMPIERIAGLQAALCPMERGAMLQSAFVILRFYQELARDLSQTHGLAYPAKLDRVMVERLEKLRAGGGHDAV